MKRAVLYVLAVLGALHILQAFVEVFILPLESPSDLWYLVLEFFLELFFL